MSKYIFINQLVACIAKLVKQKKQNYKKIVNKKRVKQLITINIKVFCRINSKLIYKTINKITKK